MNVRRSVGALVVFLTMNGTLMGSDTEKRLQVRWSELKQVIGGKKVTLQLAEGARVEGRIREVTDTSLAFKVKTSSNLADYPKGKIQIPREIVSRIEIRGLGGNKGNKAKRIVATAATFFGTLYGTFGAVRAAGSDSGATVGEGVVVVSVPTAAAVLVYRALVPKDVTHIEILPDSPGARLPKPADKDESSNTPASGEALPPLTL